jgi:hypothetical protein
MVKVVEQTGKEVTVEATVRLRGSLLEMDRAILQATNAVGRSVTEQALTRFEADGRSIRIGEIKLTARGRDPIPRRRTQIRQAGVLPAHGARDCARQAAVPRSTLFRPVSPQPSDRTATDTPEDRQKNRPRC